MKSDAGGKDGGRRERWVVSWEDVERAQLKTEPLRLRLPAALAPVHALERKAHHGARQRLSATDGLVRNRDARHVPAHRRRRTRLGHRVDERRHRLRACRQSPQPLLRKPLCVDAEVGPHRPLGVAAEPSAGRPDVAPELKLDVRPEGRRGRRGSVERGFEKHGRASVPPEHGPPFYSR